MRGWLTIAALVCSSTAAAESGELPPVSHDGLVLDNAGSETALYLRPGAEFSGYHSIQLLDCVVAFHPDWQREHNARAMDAGRPVTDSEMLRMRKALAAEFRQVFSQVLSAGEGYPIVTDPGPGVLLVKPAIVNLVVTVPAARAGPRQYSNLTSAGAMMLYAELVDSVSGAILARIIAPAVSKDADFEMRDARLVNRQEADEILSEWATALRDRLESSSRRSGR